MVSIVEGMISISKPKALNRKAMESFPEKTATERNSGIQDTAVYCRSTTLLEIEKKEKFIRSFTYKIIKTIQYLPPITVTKSRRQWRSHGAGATAQFPGAVSAALAPSVCTGSRRSRSTQDAIRRCPGPALSLDASL